MWVRLMLSHIIAALDSDPTVRAHYYVYTFACLRFIQLRKVMSALLTLNHNGK